MNIYKGISDYVFYIFTDQKNRELVKLYEEFRGGFYLLPSLLTWKGVAKRVITYRSIIIAATSQGIDTVDFDRATIIALALLVVLEEFDEITRHNLNFQISQSVENDGLQSTVVLINKILSEALMNR